MNDNYNSNYGQQIKQFIDLKRALGFKFKTSAVILLQIDRLAEKNGETSPGIRKEFAEKWCMKRLYESDIYTYSRVRMLAMFSSYLCDLGIPSYIPKLPRYQKSTFIPYIYTAKEIEAAFRACDELRLQAAHMSSSLFSAPALIRLLYSTGLRISEALAISNTDINLDENYLHVKDSKNGKERIIPISDSLSIVCKEYLRQRNKLPVQKTKSNYFFINLNGSKCSYQSITSWFRQCLRTACIQHVDRNHLPRIHDLRHTFAVTALAQMAEAGIDLYASLPVLSTYLGHQSLEGTNHYVRLTANMYPGLLKDVDTVCLDVFPKFKNYEAD